MRLLQCLLTANDCYKAKQTIRPKGIMVHSTGANNPMLRRYVQPTISTLERTSLLAALGTNPNRNDWNRTGTNACVHGFIGKLANGTVAVVQTLPWNWRGWHAGVGSSGRSANNTHISFEICEDGLSDPRYFVQAYRAAVELTAMLCREYRLNPLADGVVICHREGCRRGIASNHADVEHWFPRHGKSMDTFRADVAREMNGKKEELEMTKDELLSIDKTGDKPSSWAKASAEKAKRKGLLTGDGKGNYGWQVPLTTERLAVILDRAGVLDKLPDC